MTNHRVENSRRNFLLTIASGIAGLMAGSWPARILAQAAGGPPLSIGAIGAGREGGALGALFVKAGHRVMFSSRHPDTLKGLVDELGPLARSGSRDPARSGASLDPVFAGNASSALACVRR
jgi:8-hydroxy-5-deazaflavin:NADPH oxidoreductase